jgi:hypothetical protein
MNFSPINDTISQGNPISWANIINPYSSIEKKIKKPYIGYQIYQGSPLPLRYEDIISSNTILGDATFSTLKNKDQPMFYFNNYECKPECCLSGSAYTCDTGCVCFDQGLNFKKEMQNLKKN